MKKLWMLLVLGLCATAQANDSAVTGAGGRWRRLGKEHAQVQMVSETVAITIRDLDFYTTEANFVFRNDGPAQTVRMGFPEGAAGDASLDAKQSSFVRFETWVDSRKVKATRVLSKRQEEEEEQEALWIKSVPFGRNQTRRVRVRYQSPFGGTAGVPFSRWACYDFTGGNWKGRVASSRLTVRLDRPGTYLVGARTEKSKPQFVRRGREFSYEWHDWQAEEFLTFYLDTTLRGWVGYPGFYNPKTQRVSDSLLPVNIDIPGRWADEARADYVPLGVVRGGKLWVSLRDWLDFVAKKQPVTQRWDAKTRMAILERSGQTAHFRDGQDGVFSVVHWDNKTMFVPAESLGKAFGAGFRLDAKAHRLEFLN